MVNNWMIERGFSVGLADIVPGERLLEKKRDQLNKI